MSRFMALCVVSCATLATICLGRLMAAQESTPTGESGDEASFKPVIEAPLPEGFPSYTPVGEIEVKRYPAYRKAETSGKVAFWTLFQHITTAGISMTAPVEMTFQADGPPVGREQAMAFLYGDKSIGSIGRKGNVQVVDVPAATVVCLGVRGVRSDEVLVQAERELRNWLDDNRTRYEQSGPVRVMGYNSPFIARERQFFEVQIPVRELSDAAEA
jgi:hypothetical protein